MYLRSLVSQYRSDRSDVLLSSSSFSQSYKCYYCQDEFSQEQEYVRHSVTYHKGKPAQPDRKMIELMRSNGIAIEPKENPWEH